MRAPAARAFVVALALAVPMILGAAGTMALVPPPGCDDAWDGLRLCTLEVETRITDTLAVTEVKAGFQNTDGNGSVEARLDFPFPENGVLTQFRLVTANETFTGVVYERAQARQSFEDAVEQDEHAVLLESAGRGLLALRVNVPAGEAVVLEMTYAQILPLVGGTVDFVFPLDSVTNGMALDHLAYDLYVEVAGGWSSLTVLGLDFTTVSEEEGVVHKAHESSWTVVDSPVQVQFAPTAEAFGSVMILSGFEEDAAAILQLLPPADGLEPLPLDVVFLVDVSGSMGTAKMAQARDAMHTILDELRAHDRFALAEFATHVSWFDDDLQDTTPGNLAAAHDWVADLVASGMTNISGAVYDAFGVLERSGHGAGMEGERLPVIVLITDGMPNQWISDPRDIVEVVDDWNHFGARLHTVGIGFDQRHAFLNELAYRNQGIYRGMDWEADAAVEIAGFYDEIGTPVLRDVTVEFPELDVWEVHPDPLRDVYAGSHLVLAARVNASDLPDEIQVVVRGEVHSGPFETTLLVDASRLRVVEEAEKLWAREKATTLERQLELGTGDDGTREALVLHGLRHQIGTMATSWLIVKEAELEAMLERIQQRLEGATAEGEEVPDGDRTGTPEGSGPPAPGDVYARDADPVDADPVDPDPVDPALGPGIGPEATPTPEVPAAPMVAILLLVGLAAGVMRRRA